VKRIFIILLCVAVLVVSIGSISNIIKDDIRLATTQELIEVDDIGNVLSDRIVTYIKTNKNCSIDDLIRVNGIGEQRLKEIKKHYY